MGAVRLRRRYGTLARRSTGSPRGKVCVLELELDGAAADEVPGSVTVFIAADVPELERRLRDRATESTGEIGERIELAREQLEQAHRFRYMVRNDDVEQGSPQARGGRGLRARVRRYHGAAMIHPRLDELLDRVEDSRYALVIVAAKRARQINNYHHQLGEGIGFDEALHNLIESCSKNYLTIAMEEIAARSRTTPTGLAGPTVARILLGVTGIQPTGRARWCACSSERADCILSSRPRPLDSSPRRPSSRSPGGRGARALPASRVDLLVVAPLTANTLARPRTAWRTTS